MTIEAAESTVSTKMQCLKAVKTVMKDEPTWESIGFQQEEFPERDVRGSGMLGVLILISLAELEPEFVEGVLEKAKSSDAMQVYPLATAIFEVTVTALKALRAHEFRKAYDKLMMTAKKNKTHVSV